MRLGIFAILNMVFGFQIGKLDGPSLIFDFRNGYLETGWWQKRDVGDGSTTSMICQQKRRVSKMLVQHPENVDKNIIVSP